MSTRVYISADYDSTNGDQKIVEELTKWGSDAKHKIEFVDLAQVKSGSVSKGPDCRICDLKAEFNRQINASSAIIFVVGDMTAKRTAGSACERVSKEWYECLCTPYKKNCTGKKFCKVYTKSTPSASEDVSNINSYSYLRHEFEQAKKKGKKIIIVYNSTRKEQSWLPWYMNDYKDDAQPFWVKNLWGDKVGNYDFIKKALGYA